jgi:hypothetical protein
MILFLFEFRNYLKGFIMRVTQLVYQSALRRVIPLPPKVTSAIYDHLVKTTPAARLAYSGILTKDCLSNLAAMIHPVSSPRNQGLVSRLATGILTHQFKRLDPDTAETLIAKGASDRFIKSAAFMALIESGRIVRHSEIEELKTRASISPYSEVDALSRLMQKYKHYTYGADALINRINNPSEFSKQEQYPDPYQKYAIEALAKTGHSSGPVIDCLVGIMNTGKSDVRLAAIDALVTLTKKYFRIPRGQRGPSVCRALDEFIESVNTNFRNTDNSFRLRIKLAKTMYLIGREKAGIHSLSLLIEELYPEDGGEPSQKMYLSDDRATLLHETRNLAKQTRNRRIRSLYQLCVNRHFKGLLDTLITQNHSSTITNYTSDAIDWYSSDTYNTSLYKSLSIFQKAALLRTLTPLERQALKDLLRMKPKSYP